MIYPIRTLLWLLVIALATTVLFWWPLYRGAGFIGGDLYPYFFPQKAFYADSLKAGYFPLWNDLSGFGYPVLGESQTGAAYPFHVLFYLSFDLNTAYNIEHLLHYVICFAATFLFAKRLGLTEAGSYLAAIVFTYGWFPPRACLEWAILTGAWLPVALWCAESFLQTRRWKYAIGLSLAIGLQLLAGHFHLAFITQLLVVSYAAWRLWSAGQTVPHDRANSDSNPCRKSATIGLTLALLAGVSLACVQVLPTWELKQRSSRVITGGDYDPAYGHMPPEYLSQLIAPWKWYSLQEIDEDNLVRDIAEFLAPWHWFGPRHDSQNANQPYDLQNAIQRCQSATTSTGTNKIEAHCYCGIVPVLLAFLWIISWIRGQLNRSKFDGNKSILEQQTLYWLIVGVAALIYSTGLLQPIARNIPGFGFFRGPGRYGIVTTLAVALLAGEMFGVILRRIPVRPTRFFLLLMIFGSTCGDLWLVSRMVKYTVLVWPPRISFREESLVRQRLLAEPTPPRLLAPGPNVGNLLGVSCVPWYLGIAPAEYVDPQFAMPAIPKPLSSNQPTLGNPELTAWLSRSGVTHVLSFDPLDEASWQVEPLWKGTDPFLNRVWGRSEPLYLYRFLPSQRDDETPLFPGRAYVTEGSARILWSDWQKSPPGLRRLKLESDHDGRSKVILTELDFPGWTVRQGNQPLDATREGLFRAIESVDSNGEIVWTYEPWSVYCGAAVSAATFFLLALMGHMRFWHPRLTDRLVRRLIPWNQ